MGASAVSELNEEIFARTGARRNRPIGSERPRVCMDGDLAEAELWRRCQEQGGVGGDHVDQGGEREMLGVALGAKEDSESWTALPRHLKERGLRGVKLFASDKCLGLIEDLAEFYPEAGWQRCVVHFYRNARTMVPRGKGSAREAAATLEAIHGQDDREAARAKAAQVVAKLREMGLAEAADPLAAGVEERLNCFAFPSERWRSVRTSNPQVRVMREIRRRTRLVGAFPDGRSALTLVAARLRRVAASAWGKRRHLNMSRLREVAAGAA